MRRALLGLLALAACPRPAPPVPLPPAAPELEVVTAVQLRRLFTLRGVAADDVVVRLFADAACAGPVYLQTTGAALGQGVRVELVQGTDNFFSANAVSSLGVTSECSAPVRLSYVAAVRPGRPSVGTSPSSPSRELRFALFGAATSERVQLHEGSCGTPTLAELSAADYFHPGFVVDVAANTTRTLALNSVNEDAASDCVTVSLTNDSLPPSFVVRLSSPSPSPQRQGWVLYLGDVEASRLDASPDCTGPPLGACASCRGFLVEFPPDASTQFSVLGADRAGNTTCVTGDRPWVHDPSLPEDEAVVLIPSQSVDTFQLPPLAQVPAGRSVVDLFRSSDCSGLVAQSRQAAELVFGGVYLLDNMAPSFITARSYRPDGGVDACSNAVWLY